MALTYYLSIDGIVGNSLREGYEGAFVIADYSFDVSALVSALSGSGSSTSKSTFSPLVVDLKIGFGLTDLLKDIAGGRHISSIELKGVSPDGERVYDLKLGDVFVTQLHDTDGSDRLAFTYQQVSLTTWSQDNTGQFNPVTVSWNIETNREGASIPDPIVPTGAPHGSGGTNFYLTVDGIVGDSLSDQHRGAFEISDYSFDVSALVSALSGSGSSTSKSTFSPLIVDLKIGSGLTDLLKDIAGGRHISSIELQGDTANGTLAYDLKLGDVFVTQLHDTDGIDRLAFTYQQVSLTTWSQDNTGQSNPVTVSWNIETNREGASIPDPVVPTGAPHGSGGTNFYLTVDGIVGDSLSDQHRGAFEISDYSFDVSALVSALSGSGSSTSKSTFSPLIVDLKIGSGLTDLLKDIAGGRHISSIELQGDTANGTLAYDLKLGDVFVTQLHDTDGIDRLAFTYQQVSLTTWSQDNTGQSNPVTVSWNIETNREGASIPDPIVPTGAPHGSGGTNFYLTVDGIVGDS
uniref:type VI secretion system tube protein Hcp n=1 Tax=Bradyrhizobium sp. SZCCHNG3015 TaxID=3057270 RepID=UPI0028E45218